MTLLVTSATGANGAGYGKILAFADDGKPIGVFGDDPALAAQTDIIAAIRSKIAAARI